MPTKSISTQQAGITMGAATYLPLSTVGPVTVYDIEGETNSVNGNNYYIQLLGTATPTSGTTVPLYSRLAVPAAAATGVNGFSFVYRPGALDTSTMSYPEAATVGGSNTLPVYVAISSTDNVYTSVAANTQVTVTIEDTLAEIANQVIVGDLTTPVASLVVFADPGATHSLIQFQVTSLINAKCYLMLFAYPNPAAGALPLQQWTVNALGTITKRFNTALDVMQQDASYVNHTGCYLYGSSTAQYFTAASSWYMKAWYV